jgi:hypothetical protein
LTLLLLPPIFTHTVPTTTSPIPPLCLLLQAQLCAQDLKSL